MSSRVYNDASGGIPDPHGRWKQAIQQRHDQPTPSVEYPPLPEVAYDRDALPEATVHTQNTPYGSDAAKFELGAAASHGEPNRTQYCCGMTKTAFWIGVLVAVLIVAGAIAGGVAGSLKSIHHSNQVTIPTYEPLSGSKLAALNWTDEASLERRAVFYQVDGALFVSQAQGQNKTWTQLNISAQFVQYEGKLGLNPRNGTPLATAATPWQAGKNAPWDGVTFFSITLFYFDQANQVRQLWTSVGDLSKWQQGGNFTEVATTANPSTNSQIAATGYYCGTGCLNTMCIAFQAEDNSIQCSCSETGNPADVIAAFPNSPLMLLPFAADNGGNITYDSELLVLFLDNSDIGALAYNSGDSQKWDSSPNTAIMPSLAQVNGTLPEIVASVSDGLSNVLVVAMTADGNFTASWWQGSTKVWTANQLPSFSNQNGTAFTTRPGISSISMNNDHRLYGIAADKAAIIEYEWSSTSNNHYSFTWAGSINVI